MEPDELDLALSELEVRLERLRALYEQYFLGIERIEPTIARKDVDRRMYLLRREKIRNTGRRYKLQTLIQRYNTFQQYWQRICREIENGTYRRHLLRAEKNVGPVELLTSAARRRFGKQRESLAEPTKAAAPSASAETDVADFRKVPMPRMETPTVPRGEVPPLPPLSAPPVPRVAAPHVAAPPTPPATPKPRPRPEPLAAASEVPQTKQRESKRYESLELDMDFMGDWDPGRGMVQGGAPGGALRPKAPPPKAPPPKASPPKPPPVNRPPPPVTSAVQPSEGRRLQRSTSPGLAPPPPTAVGPAAPRAVPKAGTPPANSLSEGRIRELHGRLLDANQKANQPAVSLDGLTRSLRAAEAKLRAQHGSRRIDFEVILKEGKPVLKPVVR